MHSRFYRPTKKNTTVISIPNQEQWRNAQQVRWIELFDEIDTDLSGILRELNELIASEFFRNDDERALLLEHAKHLARLLAETRKKLP